MSKASDTPADIPAFEFTREHMALARPVAESHPHLVAASARARGRPKASPDEKKLPVSIRLDPLVIGFYRGQGTGWQSRMNDDLLALVVSRGAPASRAKAGPASVPTKPAVRRGGVIRDAKSGKVTGRKSAGA